MAERCEDAAEFGTGAKRAPARQWRRAAAMEILNDDRRKYHGHGGRRRDRERDRIARKIAAQSAERDRSEDESGTIVDIGRIDPNARPRPPQQISESRLVVQ